MAGHCSLLLGTCLWPKSLARDRSRALVQTRLQLKGLQEAPADQLEGG